MLTENAMKRNSPFIKQPPLKVCPFCGGDARWYFGDHDMYGVTCKRCTCKIYGYGTLENAIKAWNRRATDERAD